MNVPDHPVPLQRPRAQSATAATSAAASPRYVDGPATVTLRQPPPLDTPMEVERDGDGSVRVRHGRTLIGEAEPSPTVRRWRSRPRCRSPRPTRPPGSARYFTRSGVSRLLRLRHEPAASGDGLRIFPGPVTGLALWAAPWTPDRSVADSGGRVRAEVVWAALDCPSGIAAAEAATAWRRAGWDTAILLGRMTATTLAARPSGRRPVPGDRLAGTQRDGRKLTAGSALLGPGGEVLAVAGAVWLTVPRLGRVPAARLPPEAAGRRVTATRAAAWGSRRWRPRRDVIVRAAVLADELGYEIVRGAGGLGPGLDAGADRDRAAHHAGSSSPPASCRSGDAPRRRWR